MKNIRDLHFEKEILPLFDFVHHEYSRDILIRLLSEIPDTLAEVLMRQEILRRLINMGSIFAAFSYPRSEFYEAYRYIEDLRNRGTDLSGGDFSIRLFFSSPARGKESGQLGRLFIFFHKLYQAYFSHLDPESFPKPFGSRLENIRRFFSELELEKYQAIARSRRFRIAEIVKMTEKLGKKIREGEMAIFWEDLFLFEAYLSISKGIRKNDFKFPEFGETVLAITNFYHPLLKEPVKNSLIVHERVILITGPNMSGKSTMLKSIGLCVLLGHLGLAVPAEKCEMDFYDVISIAINLNDDIKSGYSHFMTEIKTLKNVVIEAGHSKKCFAIFDELFRGTNVEDALAISATTILGLTKFAGSCFFISTHLHQLRDIVLQDDGRIGKYYVECELSDGGPVFTYRLLNGWSDLKIGQILFEQEGLNGLLRV
jgi:DNA mismatch repair protein MutS